MTLYLKYRYKFLSFPQHIFLITICHKKFIQFGLIFFKLKDLCKFSSPPQQSTAEESEYDAVIESSEGTDDESNSNCRLDF